MGGGEEGCEGGVWVGECRGGLGGKGMFYGKGELSYAI